MIKEDFYKIMENSRFLLEKEWLFLNEEDYKNAMKEYMKVIELIKENK